MRVRDSQDAGPLPQRSSHERKNAGPCRSKRRREAAGGVPELRHRDVRGVFDFQGVADEPALEGGGGHFGMKLQRQRPLAPGEGLVLAQRGGGEMNGAPRGRSKVSPCQWSTRV